MWPSSEISGLLDAPERGLHALPPIGRPVFVLILFLKCFGLISVEYIKMPGQSRSGEK